MHPNSVKISRKLSNGKTEIKIISCDKETQEISDLLYKDLINTDIKEILKLNNNDLYLEFFTEEGKNKKLIDIVVHYNELNFYRPVIAFSGSDFNSDEKLKKVVIDKVKEYQNKFDKIWSDFLTRHNITSNSRLL